MRAMLRRLTRAACISVHAPDGSHSYVAIFFILVLPNTEGTPRRVTQLSQYGGNLTIVLEVQFHGFHAFFTRVHGHPPFWSRILSAHPTAGNILALPH